MSKQKTNETIADFKTICCNSKWHRRSRANFRCNQCDGDVTMEIIVLGQAIIEEEKK